MKRIAYRTPAVLQVAEVALERNLLAGPSVYMEVESTGQEVKEYDFTDTNFNHEWGE